MADDPTAEDEDLTYEKHVSFVVMSVAEPCAGKIKVHTDTGEWHEADAAVLELVVMGREEDGRIIPTRLTLAIPEPVAGLLASSFVEAAFHAGLPDEAYSAIQTREDFAGPNLRIISSSSHEGGYL